MMRARAWYFMPFAALVVLAAIIGLRLGHAPSDSDLITRYAAVYQQIAPAGAAPRDCVALPHPEPDLRLLIICTHPQGQVVRFELDHRGARVTMPRI